MRIERDARVLATDGAVGRVTHVIADPETREVTEIVVASGGEELLLPIEDVAEADGHTVGLLGGRAALRGEAFNIASDSNPLVKIPLGLALRRWNVVRRGVVSTLAGYAILIAAAALTFLILRLGGTTTIDEFVNNHEVEKIAHPGLAEVLVSAGATAAGLIMIAACGRSVIAGILVALILVPAAATIGMAVGSGQQRLIRGGCNGSGSTRS